MPDVSRLDASRPRVSFNRNVHVKRINAPNTANAYSLSSDGTSLVPTTIRRERPLTKKEMTKEAEVVLKQVDKVSCTATTNVKFQEEDKTKARKKRKDAFSFLIKKNDKPEKIKNSSSDVDSGSSQEYRIYRVNPAVDKNKYPDDEDVLKQKSTKNKKNYDFLSLDRKRLKKERKKEALDYLSLEQNDALLQKMKRKPNRTQMSTVFDKGRKWTLTTTQVPGPQEEDGIDKSVSSTKQQSTQGTGNPGGVFNHSERKKGEHTADKMMKKVVDKNPGKLTKMNAKETQNETCHNDNSPFSYANGDKNDLEFNLDTSNMQDLVDIAEDLKSASPTSDVIYAQVVVGGRNSHTQKATVNERVASNEVGRVLVGEGLNQSQVGINYKINPRQNEGVCEIITVNGDEIFKKEKFEDTNMSSELYPDSHGYGDSYYRKSSESDCTSPSPAREPYTKVVKITHSPQNHDGIRNADKPSDLHDLSIRREILISRSESQAKERFNSLKRLQEPARIKRHVSMLNGVRHDNKPPRNDVRYLDDDIKVNEKPEYYNSRKKPKDVGTVEPTVDRKRDTKVDTSSKDKEEIWRNSDKIHVIKTDDDDDNILRKLSRIGKSKSFIQDKPKSKKMEKMKMLFKKKKEGKSSESEDDPLAARYIEYRGSDVELSDKSTDSSPRRTAFKTETSSKIPHPGRKQIPTPAFSDATGTLTKIKNNKNKDTNWFQSLNKRERKIRPKKVPDVSSDMTNYPKSTNLRFFGDTDQETTTNEPNPLDPKVSQSFYRSGRITDSDQEDQLMATGRPDSRMTNSSLKGTSSGKYKSKYDLDKPDYGVKQMNYGLNITSNKFDNYPTNLNDQTDSYDLNGVKYGARITRSASSVTNSTKYGTKEKLRNLKSTPATTSLSRAANESLSRRVMSHGNLYNQPDKYGGRRKLYDSSAESATEGDSSQHSSKSMIYLHAATVGDIPGPRNIYKSERRSESREELSSIGDNGGTVTPSGKKTLSRSISVLAPWRPKHNKEDKIVNYDTVDYNTAKPPTGIGKNNKRSSSKERKFNELRFNTIGKENRRRKDLLR